MKPDNKTSLRYLLVISQLVITVVLSWVGQKQRSIHVIDGHVPWDYVAPAETILDSINFPAAITTGLLTNRRVFSLHPQCSKWRFAVYLCLIAGLWYAVGVCIERRYLNNFGNMTKRSIIVGLIASLFLFLAAILLIGGPSAPLLLIAAFLWSSSLIYFFVRLLLRLRRSLGV